MATEPGAADDAEMGASDARDNVDDACCRRCKKHAPAHSEQRPTPAPSSSTRTVVVDDDDDGDGASADEEASVAMASEAESDARRKIASKWRTMRLHRICAPGHRYMLRTENEDIHINWAPTTRTTDRPKHCNNS